MSDRPRNNRTSMTSRPTGIILTMVMAFFFIAAIVLIIAWVYRDILRRAGVENADNSVIYSKHFVMIVDATANNIWPDVHDTIQTIANERDAYIEYKPLTWNSKYTMRDLVDRSIAAGVDGIILEANAESDLSDKIEEAYAAGIPVVTLMGDAPQTKRISYVGINPYALGLSYAYQLILLMGENAQGVNILVFLNDDDPGSNEYQIFTSLNTELLTSYGREADITAETVRLSSNALFVSDEEIRSHLRGNATIPDYVICFDSSTTDAAYQAVIDYNLADRTQIIGYYLSDTTRDGLNNGIIPVTMVPDAEAMSDYCTTALLDYLESGYANSYYGVPMYFLNGEEVNALER